MLEIPFRDAPVQPKPCGATKRCLAPPTKRLLSLRSAPPLTGPGPRHGPRRPHGGSKHWLQCSSHETTLTALEVRLHHCYNSRRIALAIPLTSAGERTAKSRFDVAAHNRRRHLPRRPERSRLQTCRVLRPVMRHGASRSVMSAERRSLTGAVRVVTASPREEVVSHEEYVYGTRTLSNQICGSA